MNSLLVPNAVDRGFDPRTITLVFAVSLLSKQHYRVKTNKDCFTRNQDNLSDCGDMSTADFCFNELAL